MTIQEMTGVVHVVKIDARRLTLPMFRQLDAVDSDRIEPFGRVRDPKAVGGPHVIGRDRLTGALVRSRPRRSSEDRASWLELPLIVLGIR
jgi:hypothetical protein